MRNLRKIVSIKRYILRFANKSWYPGLVAILAAIDFFVLVIPTDAFLVSAVFGQTKRWLSIGITVAIGSTFGASILALLLHYDRDWLLQSFPSIFQSSTWNYAVNLLESFGEISLFISAAGPVPLQPFVVLSGLSPTLSLRAIIFWLFLGRLVKFIFFAWCASHAPRLLKKLWIIRGDKRSLQPSSK